MPPLTCTCTLDGIAVEADIVITSYHAAERLIAATAARP